MPGVVDIKNEGASMELTKAVQDPTLDTEGISEAYQVLLRYTSSVLYVKRLSLDAVVPHKQSGLDAGYYIYTPKDIMVPSKGYVVIDTGLAITIPKGTYGHIASIQLWAESYGFHVAPYSFGPGFDGPVKVTLFSSNESTHRLRAGFRVAVLVIGVIAEPKIVEINNISKL